MELAGMRVISPSSFEIISPAISEEIESSFGNEFSNCCNKFGLLRRSRAKERSAPRCES